MVTVFSCAASRNKRRRSTRGGQWAGVTLTGSTLADGASGGATSIAKLRPYAGGGSGPRDPKGSQKLGPVLRPNSVGFGLRAPRVGRRPSAQARRFYEPQKHDQQLSPTRRENRSRFSRPKNSRSPKHSPVLRPVSASLRLRFRSAGAARHAKDERVLTVARGNSCRIGQVPTDRICPFRRAGDGFHTPFDRAPWEILSKHASAF